MKKWLMVVILALLAAGAYCCAEAGVRCGSLTIEYCDAEDSHHPVCGAEFTCMKIGIPVLREENGVLLEQYDPVPGCGPLPDDEDPAEAAERLSASVRAAYLGGKPDGGSIYKGKTGKHGILKIKHMEPGMYLAAETAPAKNYLASLPFIFTIPKTEKGKDGKSSVLSYDAEAQPKPVPCGTLRIMKTVKGNGGDKNRSFGFRVNFGTEGPFHFQKSDGTEGTVSGEDSFRLSHGQWIVFSGIPAGTAYEVKENDADREGYRTESTGASGRIRKQIESRAEFVNTKYQSRTMGGGGTGAGFTLPVKTGDPSNLLFPALAMLISMTAAWIMIRKKGGGTI